MENSTFWKPKLDPNTRVFAKDDHSGYLETKLGLKKINGDHIEKLVSTIVPLLDGTNNISSILEQSDYTFDVNEIKNILSELDNAGAFEPEQDNVEGALCQILDYKGDESLSAQMRVMLETIKIETGTVTETKEKVTILTTRSIFDPEFIRLERELINSQNSYICVGTFGAENRGFVGPLRKPGYLGGCMNCMRTRLNSNSRSGQLRAEYTSWLKNHNQKPFSNLINGELVLLLSSWCARHLLDTNNNQNEKSTLLIFIDGNTMSSSIHTLLPVPTCTVCGHFQIDSQVGPPLNMECAFDEEVGIVHSLNVNESKVGPRIFISGTTSGDSSFIRSTMRAVTNGGAGYTADAARMSSLGESLERYSAGIYNSSSLYLATWNDLREDAVDPMTFCSFSNEQYNQSDFPYVRFDENTQIRWTRATRWSDKTTIWVPASQVYLPYRRVKGEASIGPSISSGMAAGASFEDAVLGGLQEIIERDALAISWMHKLPPRNISNDSLNKSTILMNLLHNPRRWNVNLYDLTLDGPLCTIAAVMKDQTSSNDIVGFGSACRRTLAEAAEKAFLEAAQGLTYIERLLEKYKNWLPGDDFEHVNDFNQHAILYSKFPELRSRVDYLVDPSITTSACRPATEERPHGNDGNSLNSIISQLREMGYETYVVDLTTPDVAMLGTCVVRVLVPGFVHLSGTHGTRFLGSERLLQVPRQLGFASMPDNIYPHPLP